MKDLIESIHSFFDFPLRQLFRWRRAGLVFENQDKQGLYNQLEPIQAAEAESKARKIKLDYRLDYLFEHSSRQNYRENLFYIEMLERAVDVSGIQFEDHLDAADIGVSTWFYVQGLYAFLRYWAAPQSRSVRLLGFEVDPYRVFPDWYSRYDHAVAHIGPNISAEFIPYGFSEQPYQFGFVSLFFPFVFSKDHLEWGLPRRLYTPQALLSSAWNSLKPGGFFLVVNQGEEEHLAYKSWMQQFQIPVISHYRHESNLFQYDYPRYILTAVKA